MTLILNLNLGMAKMYLHAKYEVTARARNPIQDDVTRVTVLSGVT